MGNKPLLISQGNLTSQSLDGQVVVITGAGGGIGFEAARALTWLGARVVIAEINTKTGKPAAERINQEFGRGMCSFVQTDVDNELSVANLARQALKTFGKVDVVFNNATIAPLGAVKDKPIAEWDASYRVNLRGPVLLAQAFLPGMLQRKSGVFVCVSSVGGIYMGAYEIMKTAQVELAKTLDGELEDSGVIAFTIGPGIVPTATAQAGVAQIAPLYGKTVEEFFASYKNVQLSVEAAGAGFAAAVVLARQFKGVEIIARQALNAAGIELPDEETPAGTAALTAEQRQQALELCQEVRRTLAMEINGWKQRSLFERQWMLRYFKQHAGLSADDTLAGLDQINKSLEAGEDSSLAKYRALPGQIARYYQFYGDLAKSFIKDPAKLTEYLGLMQGWREEAENLGRLIGSEEEINRD
jgi:NAD(P)-dependent dehydrogenase (short-subunit alcohol dehydrogenase family)